MSGGRPRAELTPIGRRELRRIARRVRRLERELELTRTTLAEVAAAAHGEGASVRSIAVELELGVAATHRLVALGRELELPD